jgi:hypothetical protein
LFFFVKTSPQMGADGNPPLKHRGKKEAEEMRESECSRGLREKARMGGDLFRA